MNSINWPASSIWVFIAQLGEHCSANAEATGSNPVEAPKNFFSGYFLQLLKLRFTAMVTYSFHLLICPLRPVRDILRASTICLHRDLSFAACCASPDFKPISFISVVTVRDQVVLGQPCFLFPGGVHLRQSWVYL